MKSKALILLSGFMFVMLAGWTSFLFAADIKLVFRFNDPEAKEMREALDVFEKNNPASFKNPLYSFRADMKMYSEMLRGKITF